MDFSFPISKALDIQDGFAIINSAPLDPNPSGSGSPSKVAQASSSQLRPTKESLGEILDTMGKLSSKAQGLKHPVTSYSKFMITQGNKAYIKADQYKIYGFLRTETKKLSYKDPKEGLKEAKFVCIIDFYVHESAQRAGVGKAIFEKMLKTEQLQPNKLAYKRPSLELLSFLKKYYGLTDPVTQPNSYIIFGSFFGLVQTQVPSPKLPLRRDSSQSNNATDISQDTIEEQKESKRMPAFDLNVAPKAEKEQTKKTALIDLLLKAPSLLENNIFDQIKEKSPEPRDVTLFENEGARRFYNEVYKWHWNLEKEIAEEAKVLKRKQFLKTSSDEDNFDY